jgi:hypothetical protein
MGEQISLKVCRQAANWGLTPNFEARGTAQYYVVMKHRIEFDGVLEQGGDSTENSKPGWKPSLGPGEILARSEYKPHR